MLRDSKDRLARLAAVSVIRYEIMQRWIRFPRRLWGQLASEEFFLAVEEFVQRHGSVDGIVGRMERLGLGSVVHSWLESNVYEPILSEQLHALFGTGVLRAFAAKLDLPPRDLVLRLSQALPRVLNRLASPPQGW